MPVSFVPLPTFGPSPVRPVRPPRPKHRGRKPPAVKPKPKPKGPRVLSPQVRTLLLDRVWEAVRAKVVDLMDDHAHCETVEITAGEFACLMRVLFPEEYFEPVAEARATPTAPGSDDRIAEYAARAARGEALHAKGDATAHGAHERGLAIVQRANGSGVKVVGWAEGE